MTLVMLLTATQVYWDSSGFTVELKCSTDVRVSPLSVWLMDTLPLLPSSVTTVPSTTFIQVMLGSGMANTVQVTVAEKVTFSVSIDGVTVTFGGSAGKNI